MTSLENNFVDTQINLVAELSGQNENYRIRPVRLMHNIAQLEDKYDTI